MPSIFSGFIVAMMMVPSSSIRGESSKVDDSEAIRAAHADDPICIHLINIERCTGTFLYQDKLIRDLCPVLCSNLVPEHKDPDWCTGMDRKYCSKGWRYNNSVEMVEIGDACRHHCSGASSPLKFSQATTTAGVQPSWASTSSPAISEDFLPEPTTCPEPKDCIAGGYTSTIRPSVAWDVCTGCWQESCVRDIDFSSIGKKFKAEDFDTEYKLSLEVLEKVYPMAVEMWEYQREKAKQTGKEHYLQGIKGFLHTSSVEDWIQMNTAVHENTHVYHSTTRTYILSNDFSTYRFKAPAVKNPYASHKGQYEYVLSKSWNDAFPRRMEIWHLLPQEIQKMHQGPSYFKKPDARPVEEICGGSEGGPLGCQRIGGLITETEAYQHGVVATAWMNTGVGKDNRWTPETKVNSLHEGAPYPIAFWSLANVLYLQVIKENYSETWSNLVGTGKEDWRETAKMFLAHIDRASFILRLMVDRHGMEEYYFKTQLQRCREEQRKALQKDDVLSELRAALSPCNQ